mmetsp:Transcript_15765/g.36495  ORF Transcript_15765/g.36495 Transcript_15765/m.36495 type:complete len:254 (+) Transcript_15765:117-878(+)|eukprot:CAMPEP_0197177508 /NCGR_PEP_ID=MMETSP1423-20130617/3087_1 /TAXON_ID=476441 /ORGANISM="Pseudo-nitzschia heimii, Strain UNC1101" /LENGTH=253 /DNA_ID=CAMNT_0042627059 /DNA_START=90 /DNA_END=851 /DNA_ORIENTATION=-
MARFLSALVPVCFLLAVLERCDGFVADTKLGGTRLRSMQRNVIPTDILEDVENSRALFFIWFFGASGAASIARSAFPTMYSRLTYVQSLKGEGPTLGGDTLGVSPLCGYPEDIAVKDIQKVINNRMTIEKIVKKFPEEDNYLASKGYVTFSAFEQANRGANPMAIRAVFDTFSQSTDVSEPRVAQEKLNFYRDDVYAIKNGLLKSKITGYVTVITLLFLLGYADFTAAGHVRDGWFHYWKLADGLQNIPDFWI